MIQILIVDDDLKFLKNVSELLTLQDFKVKTASSVAEGQKLAAANHFDVLLLDLMLEDGSGLQVLEVCNKSLLPKTAVITGHPTIKSMVSNFYGPDLRYLLKPLDMKTLIDFIRGNEASELTHTDKSPEASGKDKTPEQPLHFGVLLGESPSMQRIYQAIQSVANTEANVLIQGESGAGKELVAKAIHHASQVKGPFVAANCGAFSRELIGSELFGHEKGAFTGAVARKPGLFEQANGGTLFLDEVTEMPIDLQPNLLRALETKKVVRVGGREEIRVNCRVISATNRSIEEFASEEVLREDLYYRLAVFPIDVPPLRARKDDIALLAEAFLNEFNKENEQTFLIADHDLEQLCNYDWPGNVRELRHAIHRAFILTDPASPALALPTNFASPFSRKTSSNKAGLTIEEMEKDLILSTLARLNDDKPKAAEMLGVSLKTLYNRLNSYEKDQV